MGGTSVSRKAVGEACESDVDDGIMTGASGLCGFGGGSHVEETVEELLVDSSSGGKEGHVSNVLVDVVGSRCRAGKTSS